MGFNPEAKWGTNSAAFPLPTIACAMLAFSEGNLGTFLRASPMVFSLQTLNTGYIFFCSFLAVFIVSSMFLFSLLGSLQAEIFLSYRFRYNYCTVVS